MVTTAAVTPLNITPTNDDFYSASGNEIPRSRLVAARRTSMRTINQIIPRLVLTLVAVMSAAGLLCPASASANDILDQSQPVSQSRNIVGYQLAQIFTTGMYGSLDRVSLHLGTWPSNPAGAVVNVSIQTVIDGVPSGRQVGSGTIALSALPYSESGGGWVDIDIRGPLFVVPGTPYALVIQTSAWNATVNWWYANEDQYGSGYTRGVMARNLGDGWNVYGTYDFAFKTYVRPDVLDRSQTQTNFTELETRMAQIFIPTQSGYIDRVSVFLANGLHCFPTFPIPFCQYDANGSIAVSLQTVSDGLPTGTVLSQGTIPRPNNTGTPNEYTVNMNNVPVTAGIQYALVVDAGISTGRIRWFYTDSTSPTAPPSPGGYMMMYANIGYYYPGPWEQVLINGNPTYAAFRTYIVQPIPMGPPPGPPPVITPCSDGVCPAVAANITPPASTARITSNVQFEALPDGTVDGVLNFNDSRTGDFVLRGCTTDSANCRVNVTTFVCTDQNTMTVVGTYTKKGEAERLYMLTLSGVRSAVGIFTLMTGDYTYTLTHRGIVDVTCPPTAGVVY